MPDTTMQAEKVRAWCTSKPFLGKVDLSAAFHQVHVAESTRKLLGFTHEGKSFHYTKMPMGIMNGLATFASWLRSKLTVHFGDEDVLRNYQDNIFIGSATPLERDLNVDRILKFCELHSLPVNMKKLEKSDSKEGMRVLGMIV